AARPGGIRIGRAGRLHPGDGLRADRLRHPGGRAGGRALAGAGPGAVTAEAALAAWLDHQVHERRASLRTVEAYARIVRGYLAFLQAHRGEAISLAGLGAVTAAEAPAHLAQRRSGPRPLPARSLSQTLAAI